MSLELLKEQPFFSIVLPAYNESENLPDVLRSLKKVLSEANVQSEIIVVDNGSSDNTAEVLGSLKNEIRELKTLRIEKNIGYGNGIIKGLEAAKGSILGFMVADGQTKSEDVLSVYFKLKRDDLDFCKGTRIKKFFSLERAIISKIFNALFRLMFRSPLQDINGSVKIFTRRFYEETKLSSKDWFLDAEIIIKAQKGKYSVGEVPIVYLERKKGGSSVSLLTSVEFLKNMFYWWLFKKY